MKTLRLLLGMALIAVTFSLEQCAKGDPGAPGATGATGPQGPSGVTGTSASFTSNVADWGLTAAGGYNFGLAAYTASLIDANAVANGVVAVYIQAGSSWVPLPFSYPYSSSVNATQTMTYTYNSNATGNLVLQTQNSDNTTTNLIPLAAFNVKVVVIPTAIMKQHPGLNTRDYASVMQVLNNNKN